MGVQLISFIVLLSDLILNFPCCIHISTVKCLVIQTALSCNKILFFFCLCIHFDLVLVTCNVVLMAFVECSIYGCIKAGCLQAGDLSFICICVAFSLDHLTAGGGGQNGQYM